MWLIVDEEGCPVGTPPYEAGFYRKLCLNSPYVESFLKPHVREVLEALPVDGFFFDIVQPQECSCEYCRVKMEAEGLDPTDVRARRRFGLQTVNDFKRDMTQFVRQFNGSYTIFYNAGHIGTRHRPGADAYTHFELESLPSGGWGYLHFPTETEHVMYIWGTDVEAAPEADALANKVQPYFKRIHDVTISVRAPREVEDVRLVPERESLVYDQVGDHVEFEVPRLVGHRMIAVNFVQR